MRELKQRKKFQNIETKITLNTHVFLFPLKIEVQVGCRCRAPQQDNNYMLFRADKIDAKMWLLIP